MKMLILGSNGGVESEVRNWAFKKAKYRLYNQCYK